MLGHNLLWVFSKKLIVESLNLSYQPNFFMFMDVMENLLIPLQGQKPNLKPGKSKKDIS